MRRRTLVFAGVTVAVALGGGATAAMLLDSAAPAAQASEPLPPATATVTRTDLVDTETVDGTLGYADERQIAAGASGTVTSVARSGSVVERGEALYAVDRDPVILMYGDTPMYRTLWPGAEGPDVKQLEKNLRELGYGDDMTVDDTYTGATAGAVQEWQEDAGLPETGTVDPGQIVFLPEKVRVSDVTKEVGDKVRPGQPLLTVTSTRRVVEIDLDVAYQDLVKEGAKVTVELPGGETVAGKITEVGTVAKASGQDTGGSGDPTIPVEITLNDPKEVGRLDQAPVSVELRSERREDVLSVPVEALLALREGGYGLEVVEDGRTRIIAVEVGIFAAGRVEVSAAGLREGMKVGVPAT